MSNEMAAAIVGAVVTVVVSIGGWLVGFMTAIKAQREQIATQLRVAALEQLSPAIERVQITVQDALNASVRVLGAVQNAQRADSRELPSFLSDLGAAIVRLEAETHWEPLLRQYVQLFPHDRFVRTRLSQAVRDLLTACKSVRDTVAVMSSGSYNPITGSVSHEPISDQTRKDVAKLENGLTLSYLIMDLFDDLRAVVHNIVYKPLTGREAREEDTSARERIRRADDGVIIIESASVPRA